MEFRLQQRMQQNLVMTPQLQQAIKLLQLSRLELADLVREEMMENPILEDLAEGPEVPAGGGEGVEASRHEAEAQQMVSTEHLAELEDRREGAASTPEERAASKESHEEEYWQRFLDAYSNQAPMPTQGRLSSDELPTLEATLSHRTSLTDHLEWQVRLSNFTETEVRFAMMVIYNLDESGYLTLKAPPEDVVKKSRAALEKVGHGRDREHDREGDGALHEDPEGRESAAPEPAPAPVPRELPRAWTLADLAVLAGLELEDAEEVLKMIQTLDPVGVASRDLRECLLVQAELLGYDATDVEWQVIDRHLHNVEKRNFPAIARELKCELEEVYEASKLISGLEPRPGRNFTLEDPPYITPDVYVHKVGDDYLVSTNDDGMPKLKINEQQARSLMKDPRAKDFVQKKLAQAKWFVRSLDQRQKTIVKVTQCIVEKQREFFEKGIEYLKPMILRDVATTVSMHESTISRVTTNKYVHTPRGIFELKYFFNSSIKRMAEDDIASESVKQAIKKIIAEEDPRNPFSDEQIVKKLEGQKIMIARRTVAKYREMLGILSSARRKQYY
ncbi:MAG: RNA polymerase factor sigma-54 [Deltaproteobacteria bacterium]|nr:RNA polymerase factor sigma-54 [Deltaproteobacteria bacterium]